MSGLPKATKDTSSHPGPNSVTAPVDPKAKQADIERKMQAYGVLQALRDGRYPSNKQIDETLQYTLNNTPIDEKSLSSDGRELISDVQAIIETAREMVMEKNADELFQNFLWETRQVDNQKVNPANSAGGTGVNAPVNKDDAKDDGRQAAVHLKTLGKLIFTNSEVRKLLKDVGLLARDVAADGAAKAADKARPDQEALRRAEEPAPDNEWIGPNGEKVGPNQHAPDTGLAAKRDQARETKDNVKAKAQAGAQQARSEAENRGQNAQSRMQGATAGQPSDSSNTPSREEREAAQREGRQIKEENKQEAKSAARDKFNQAKDSIPQEHKDRARETRDRTKNYMKEKFPEERRERFIYRLKKVLVEQQRHQDYQEAVDFFLDRAENYTGAAKNATGQSGGHVNAVRSDSHYQKAEQNLQTLLERFADNQSMQPIFDAVNQIYEDSRNDRDLRSWFSELNTYVRKVLSEPGFVMQDECDREGRRLRENSKGFFNERYKGHREQFINEVQRFFQSYADDRLNQQLGEDFKRLFKGLALDGDGNLTIKPHLWNDIRSVIIPQLARQVGYVPIPRVEYTDATVDLVIENLTLESQNILPNILEIEVKNYFKLSPYNNVQDRNKHSFWLSFSQIQADIRDVPFYFKKKSGFPKMSDSGIADVLLAGKGISGQVHLQSTGKTGHAFNVVGVTVKVDSLKFKVRDAKHSFLISVIRPLATGLIKKAIENGIASAIRSGLEQVNQQLSDITERLHDASGRDDVNRRDVIRDAFARRKEEAEHKAKESDKKTGDFKVSADRNSKILEWESKQSIVATSDKRAEQSSTPNRDWHSPKFDVVPPGFVGDNKYKSSHHSGSGLTGSRDNTSRTSGPTSGLAGNSADRTQATPVANTAAPASNVAVAPAGAAGAHQIPPQDFSSRDVSSAPLGGMSSNTGGLSQGQTLPANQGSPATALTGATTTPASTGHGLTGMAENVTSHQGVRPEGQNGPTIQQTNAPSNYYNTVNPETY